jgi:hypothetical protein
MDKLINAAKDYLDDDKDKRQGMYKPKALSQDSSGYPAMNDLMMPLVRQQLFEWC